MDLDDMEKLIAEIARERDQLKDRVEWLSAINDVLHKERENLIKEIERLKEQKK